MEPAYTISSPGAFGSGELKMEEKHESVSTHLALLHSEWPKRYGELAVLSVIGLKYHL